MIPALRGAIGFFTRVPISTSDEDWEAFRRLPLTIPLIGSLIGVIAGIAFLLPVPVYSAVTSYLVTIYLVTGITHADGLTDLGDGFAVHGDADRRRAVMKDAQVGVGGALLLGVTIVGLALGGLAVGGFGSGQTAFRIVLAAEVGAKLAMAFVVCYGRSAHNGLGAQLLDVNGPRSFGPAVLVAVPAALVPPTGAVGAAVAALVAPVLSGLVLLRWSERAIGGASGDVIGATNEVGRLVGLHAGVIAWVLL
ncbi:MAG: adenosylcobinamide-GDP ribazoletransferase [Halobacteriota archaeon]